ncbi:MAG TPA: amidohydrolase family protein [Myxococcales bacterium]|nr:amidohydrolase family protein [Myxococcales bacterium]
MNKLLLAMLCAASGTAFAQGDQAVVLEGARLIDGTGKAPRENSVIVVQGDRITAVGVAGKVKVPKGARVVDVHGRTIMPGLINAHGHVGLVANGKNSADAYTRENIIPQLVQYEQYGVTSIMALGLNRDLGYEIRDEQRKGGVPGASLFVAGRGIGVPDAAPPVPVAPDQVYRPQTKEEAIANVREAASHHPDMLKLWVDDIYGKFPKMKPEVFQAAIEEAHKNKIHVAAHVFYLADAKALVKAGVDALAHSIRDQPVDAELIKAMKAKGTFYVPTFTVDESAFIFAENPAVTSDPLLAQAVPAENLQTWQGQEYKNKVANDPNTPKIKAALINGMKNLKALSDAGVRIAFGTDSGAQPARVPGWAEHHELELMVRAGLTPIQALNAAGKGSAAMLGLKDRGTIEPGKKADLLVLDANPLEDIKNTRELVSIWHGGKEIKPRGRTVATK